MNKDPYETLGVSKNATKEDIKKAYRQMAKMYHPDRNKAQNAADKFKDVTESYELLMDDQKRSAFDQFGFAGTQGFGGNGSGFNMGDFGGFNVDFGGQDMGDFGDIFGSFFGGGVSRSRKKDKRGNDLQMKLDVTFLEAVVGADKNINYTRKIECPDCLGSGSQKGSKATKCSICNGNGKMSKTQRTFIGNIQTVVECDNCDGTGEVVEFKCTRCKGSGNIPHQEEITVKIPAGTPDGLTLRFTGKGNAGQQNGGYGDLFLEIEVQTHPVFERTGDDIYINKEIPMWMAVLGGEIEVPTISGVVTVKVPAGTQPDKILKLKGYGATRFRSHDKGDQYIKIKLSVPQKLSRNEKELWENLKATSGNK